MKRLKLLLLILTFSFIPSTVLRAESGSGSTGSGDSSNTDTTNTDDSSNSDGGVIHTQTETERKAALKERVEEAKQKAKTALDAAAQKRIEDRCESAQKKVTTLETIVGERAKRRNTAYDTLLDRLNNLVTKLQAKNVDTTELEQEIATLEMKIAQFKTNLTTYRQSISDLSSLACKDDPSAFKSLLEQARAQRETVKTDAEAIKEYFKETIKPTLEEIRTALEAQGSSSTDSAGQEGGSDGTGN